MSVNSWFIFFLVGRNGSGKSNFFYGELKHRKDITVWNLWYAIEQNLL